MSFLSTHLHFIWSTAQREPWIHKAWQPRLCLQTKRINTKTQRHEDTKKYRKAGDEVRSWKLEAESPRSQDPPAPHLTGCHSPQISDGRHGRASRPNGPKLWVAGCCKAPESGPSPNPPKARRADTSNSSQPPPETPRPWAWGRCAISPFRPTLVGLAAPTAARRTYRIPHRSKERRRQTAPHGMIAVATEPV